MTIPRTYLLLAVLLFAFQNTGAKQLPGENDRLDHSHEWISSGIADIDKTRQEVRKTPTTTQNAIPRRAALYRWWRFLMHQGYDLSAFDETADILLQETADLVMDQEFSTPKARQAISDGFAVLEEIYAGNLYIQEVRGSGSATQTASNGAGSPTDWPVYHGTDGGQTGYSPDPGPSKGEIAWRFPKGSNFSAKPVFENGKVYFSSPGIDVILYCLDEISGEILWNGRQYKTRCYENGGVSRVDPVLTSEGILIKSEDSFLFDKDSGILLWKGKQEDLEERLTDEPILADQIVYTASIKGEIIALNNASGDTVWTTETGEVLDGPVSLGKGRIYAGSRDAKLLCLDPSDGSVMWTFQSPDKESRSKQYFSAATEANGRVYVGSAGKHLYSLDTNSGKLVWKYMLSDWVRSRPIVVGNTVFAVTLDGEMTALRADGNKGRKKWATDLCAHGVAEDLVGNSNGILACGRDGIWYSVSPESGEIQWKHGVIDGAFVDGKYVTADWGGVGGIPTPSVVDGVVYIGGGDGFVNALDVETGKEIWRFETKASTHTLTVAADKVFFGILGSSEPKYYALNRRTGELVWESSSFGNRVWVGASYVDGRLVFGTTDGIMYGADALTGEKIWEYNIEQDIAKKDRSVPGLGIYSNPAFDDKYVYMGSWIGYYMAFDALTGKMKWKCRTFDHRRSDGRPDSSAPVLWKDHLYVQKLAEYIAAINISTGEIEWQWKAPYGWVQNGTVAAFNDKIFGSAARLSVILPYGVRIYAFNDVENGGDLLWEYEGGGGWTAPVGTEDKLIFGSNGDAFMTCLDPEDGSLKWRVYTGDIMRENVPAIYGNKVIAHFMNGWVLAIE